MNAFIKTASQYTSLSVESQEVLSAILHKMELSKGHVLIKAGTVSNKMYFIEKGLTRTFYLKDGKDITDWISMENTFAGSIVSYITRKPDIRNVELLEDSVLWAFQYQDMDQLYAQYHEIERFGRLVATHGLVLIQHRFDDLHFATASERYKKLMDFTPSLLQRVPLGMIASYLGITQETLSRIRAQH
jgi:CRP-like cAMP-binding protein